MISDTAKGWGRKVAEEDDGETDLKPALYQSYSFLSSNNFFKNTLFFGNLILSRKKYMHIYSSK